MSVCACVCVCIGRKGRKRKRDTEERRKHTGVLVESDRTVGLIAVEFCTVACAGT